MMLFANSASFSFDFWKFCIRATPISVKLDLGRFLKYNVLLPYKVEVCRLNMSKSSRDVVHHNLANRTNGKSGSLVQYRMSLKIFY